MKLFNKQQYLIVFAIINLCGSALHSQEDAPSQKLYFKNEMTINLLDLIVAGTLNLEYERFLPKQQSVLLSVNLFDTYGYYDVGYIDTNKAFSVQGAYRFYFSSKDNYSGFYFYPLAKLRWGELTIGDSYYLIDENGDETISSDYSYDIDGLGIGFGLGHTWLIKDKITFNINGQVARDLSDSDNRDFDQIEVRFNVGVGYRF